MIQGVRRVTWLLFVLFLVVALTTFMPEQKVQFHTVAQELPTVVAPEGRLLEVFEQTRPASLRIEARPDNPNYRGAPYGVGSGFFISEDGLVLTAYHVVDTDSPIIRNNAKYVAVTADEQVFDLELVSFNAYLDLALLQANVPDSVPYLPLATQASRSGRDILAIGNSQGDFIEGRAGRISRIGVQSPRATFANGTIELTAALSPGDSGGPVINTSGEAIGVVSYISFRPNSLSTENSVIPPYLQGLILPQSYASYAVPITADSDVVQSLLAGERIDRPVIGFTYANLDYEPDADNLYLGKQAGPVIGRVEPNSPADLAGLRSLKETPVYDAQGRYVGNDVEADVIVAVDDEATPTFNDLLEVIYRKGVGQTVVLSVQRGDELIKLRLTLGAKREVFQ